MKSLIILVGKLPFAGKLAVRSILAYLYGSKTLKMRLLSYFALIALFILYFFGHGSQALMGVEILVMPETAVWMKLSGLIYASINIIVIIVHMHLAIRATRFLFHHRYSRRSSHTVSEISWRETVMAVLFTLGGQFGFLAIYLVYA